MVHGKDPHPQTVCEKKRTKYFIFLFHQPLNNVGLFCSFCLFVIIVIVAFFFSFFLFSFFVRLVFVVCLLLFFAGCWF